MASSKRANGDATVLVGRDLSLDPAFFGAIREELAAILASPQFANRHKLQLFLGYAVEKKLAGELDKLKGAVIGVEALGYDTDGDFESKVKSHASRLRRALDEFYSSEGSGRPYRIEMAAGSYSPSFVSKVSIAKAPAGARQRKWLVLALALSAAGFLGLGIVGARQFASRPAPVPHYSIASRLSFTAGASREVAVADRGTLIAYSSDNGADSFDIWVRRLGEPASRISDAPLDDINPDVSADGRRVVYQSLGRTSSVQIVDLVSRQGWTLADDAMAPRISPDGRLVAFDRVEESGNSGVYVVPIRGGEPQRVNNGVHNAACPAWSSDSEHILVRGSARNGQGVMEFDWWRVTPGNRLPPVRTRTASLLSRNGFASENSFRGCPNDWNAGTVLTAVAGRIIEVSVDSRTAVATSASILHPGPHLNRPRYLALQNGTSRVVAQLFGEVPRVWEFPADLLQGTAGGIERKLIDDPSIGFHEEGVITAMTSDGAQIAWSSMQSGAWEIWVRNLNTGEERKVTDGPGEKTGPVLSRSGKRLAYLSKHGATGAIYTVELGSGVTKQLCADCGAPRDWSIGEDRLLVVRGRSLLEKDADTQGERVIVEGPSYEPYEASFSPDGRWIAAVIGVKGKTDLQGVILPASGAPESRWIPVTEERYNLALHWGPDGTLLYYFSRRDGKRCLWAQRLDRNTRVPTGEPFAVKHFHLASNRVLGRGWASLGGRRIAFNMTEDTTSLWVLQK